MSEGYIYYNPEFAPEHVGFNNTGVICWCNSILQVLLSCTSFNQTMLELEPDFANNSFALEYVRLVKLSLEYKKARSTGEESVGLMRQIQESSTRILKEFIQGVAKQKLQISSSLRFGLGQECVDEAFTLFLDMIKHQRINKLFTNVYELNITCNKCQKQVSQVRDTSYKIQLFSRKELLNQNDFCKYLQFHLSPLDSYKCESCKNVMIDTYRTEVLKMLREIVVIVFNKYQAKENRWFPQKLEFPTFGGTKLVYEQIGQIEHSGTMLGGHYYSIANRNGEVRTLNDSFIGDGKLGSTPGTYMVVYHLMRKE